MKEQRRPTNMKSRSNFELSSPSISPKDIKLILEGYVVVVGAGITGLTAALSAAEAGTSTILLEKGSGYNFRGFHNTAIVSQSQRQPKIIIS
jgi:fumarate reductase flavoprotein subunit